MFGPSILPQRIQETVARARANQYEWMRRLDPGDEELIIIEDGRVRYFHIDARISDIDLSGLFVDRVEDLSGNDQHAWAWYLGGDELPFIPVGAPSVATLNGQTSFNHSSGWTHRGPGGADAQWLRGGGLEDPEAEYPAILISPDGPVSWSMVVQLDAGVDVSETGITDGGALRAGRFGQIAPLITPAGDWALRLQPSFVSARTNFVLTAASTSPTVITWRTDPASNVSIHWWVNDQSGTFDITSWILLVTGVSRVEIGFDWGDGSEAFGGVWDGQIGEVEIADAGTVEETAAVHTARMSSWGIT